ncbi:hypothetical protein [Rhodoblastus sp.]|uniref:hypothetical protein n=1 Tax=Rhodoblastus sp. TaxID=1962975 RepID=UPI0035AF676C
MSDPLQIFIPLRKADAARRLIYGYATAELPDKAGEICDYASTKPFYEQWSAGCAKASDGKSFGNLRAMHGKIAAGKVTSIAFNDDAKRIEIAAKIVDDDEWRKIEEGVIRPRNSDRRKVEFSGLCHGGGLDEPPGFCSEIGGLLPMAPCGRSSL